MRWDSLSRLALPRDRGVGTAGGFNGYKATESLIEMDCKTSSVDNQTRLVSKLYVNNIPK